jgi:hypothetical protein
MVTTGLVERNTSRRNCRTKSRSAAPAEVAEIRIAPA